MGRLAAVAATVTSIVLAVFAAAAVVYFEKPQTRRQESMKKTASSAEIRYISIGDSYTIGNDLAEDERWPNLLVKSLRAAGISIELVANPAVSGWTVQDAIRTELPVVAAEDPNFVTVLIGANDAFRRTPVEQFRSDLRELLDGIASAVPSAKVLMVTIPDFVSSPQGRVYGASSEDAKLLAEYNAAIAAEAQARGYALADIYPISNRVAHDPAMFNLDGLHPSAVQTALWEEVIREPALKLLR